VTVYGSLHLLVKGRLQTKLVIYSSRLGIRSQRSSHSVKNSCSA